jgi:flagellar biosynthesis component FlhA
MELEKIFINDAVLIIETTDESDEELINGATTPPRDIILINEKVKEELTKQQTDEDKLKKYKLYKIEYNKKRYAEKKELLLNQQRQYYINKLQTDPTFKNKLNDKTKARYYKKKQEQEAQGIEPRPRGRPKTRAPTEKKANGRPRKYNTI